MSWYRAGTVAVTNGSAAVTLTGGDALQNISVDDGFIGPDGKTYPIQSIGGAGSFTLAYNYTGSTASGQSYVIIPVAMYAQLRTMLEEVNDLITAYQTIAINAGVGKFAVGSAAAPGVRGSGHEGTGLVWNSDESLSISVNGTIVATIGLTSGTIFRLHSQIFNIATPKADFSITADPTNNAGGVTIGYSFAAGGQGPLKFVDSVGERMRISSSGNVGIGTTSPSTRLHVKSSGEIALVETTTARGSGAGWIGIYDPTGRKGYFGYGGANDNLEIVNSMNAAVLFYTNNTERARIDAGGNLGIGVSSMTCKFHVKSSGEIARFETTTARGGGLCMHRFYDPTGEKAYTAFAGVDDTYYLMNRMNAGIIFGTNDINRWQIANNGNFYPQTDNAHNLGAASTGRIKDTYLVNSPTVTSDEREKTWHGAMSDAEYQAALQIIKELGFYQWNESVQAKGEDARYHFGPRAQRVGKIMSDYGLDPHRYAFFCYDKWEEQTEAVMQNVTVKAVYKGRGKNRVEVEPERTERVPTGETRVTVEAGDRYGVRPDQLLMFLMSAQDRRLSAIEERMRDGK